MAQNSNTTSSIVAHSFYAAGTSNLATANATVLGAGAISASGALAAGGALRSGTTITAGTGYVFGSGHTKQFACGTYIGSGAATAAIISTGLTTIHHVFMNRIRSAYSSATALVGEHPAPCKASGTPGSFYPIVGWIANGAAVNKTLGVGAPTAATFNWLALGADTL